ncbi:MAG TPA: putative maltokinase, partial [Dongiaceae bacterium]|nr:putative maltokinase [Dongiaceae bacterium]
DPARLVLPPIMDPLSGYTSVNVEAQARDQHSLLNWMRRMLEIRKRQKAFGRGSLKLLTPANRRVLAYLRNCEECGEGGETLLCVANVSRSAQAVELDLSTFAGAVPVEMIGGAAFPPIGRLPYLLTLPPYGFYWFLLAANSAMPAWHAPYPEPMPELLTLILANGGKDLLSPATVQRLERDILPAYLPKRRWFVTKNETLQTVRVAEASMLTDTDASICLAEIEASTESRTERYFLPMGLIAEEKVVGPLPEQLALARARRGKHLGYLTDAFALEDFARRVLELIRAQARLPAQDGEIQFNSHSTQAWPTIPDPAEVRWLGVEQSNSSLVVGSAVMVKILRRIVGGPHPEAEMSNYLTARGFTHIAPMLGDVVRVNSSGLPHVLAVVQGFIHSQGDGWSWLQGLFDRLRQSMLAPSDEHVERAQMEQDILEFAAVIGKRLGEMHQVLATAAENDPDFSPEIAGAEKCWQWARSVDSQLDAAYAILSARQQWEQQVHADAADALFKARSALHTAIKRLAAAGEGALCCRIHGDLHLGQILVSQQDAFFIDFEGEPARPLQERRAKTSPLRDVAGVLRSLDYAVAKAKENATPEFTALLQALGGRMQAFFLRAYSQSADGLYTQSVIDSLTDLFLLEKAAYEVVYEAENRPSWLPVPLLGMLAVAKRLQ